MTALRYRMNLVVAVAILLGVLGSSALSAAEQRGDSWRFRYWNSQWWYWMPEERWVYWQNSRWHDYPPNGQAQVVCTLCGFTEASGQSADATAVPDTRPSYKYAEPSRAYQGDAGQSRIGPLYGKSLSSTASHTSSANGEAGPFYDHAGATFDPGVDKSHFLGY